MNVIYTEGVILYLEELVEILFNKNYFSFKDAAKEYVKSITWNVEQTIHIRKKHKAPTYFSRYGKNLYYVSYPKNKLPGISFLPGMQMIRM